MGDGAAIVIVEDEFIVALDIQRQLERNGYAVKGIFPSGEELLDRFEGLRPDLVLMDIKLQGKLDGVETSGS
jgi:CheY-like chemotaxis protein